VKRKIQIRHGCAPRAKLRSSALLVAMSVGIVLSGLVVGIALTMGEYFKLSGQSREGKAAYRAALSGIDDGLLRYKYASSAAKTGNLFNVQNEEVNLGTDFSSYELSFKLDSIRVGDGSLFSPSGTNFGLWQNRSAGSLKKLTELRAKETNIDDVIDIDLSYSARGDKISVINIYFTDPYIGAAFLPVKYFTALNYQLTNVADISKGGEASQLIDENTNDNSAVSFIPVDKINQCMKSSDSCHLRIKPYAVSKKGSFAEANNVEGRLNGVIEDKYKAGKKIVYAIEARDTKGNLLEQAQYSPGTLIISSVGRAGQATRKIEAKVDLSSGKYLGLFDYGVFCGSSCEGLEGANQSE